MSSSSPSVATQQWIAGFVRFLEDVTQVRPARAFYDLITLDAAVGRRIGLGGGLRDKVPPFIGLQPFDLQWFSRMPWVEAILETSALVLIADPARTGLAAPLFGVRIPISPDYARVLSRFRSMDVREMRVDSTGGVQELGSAAAMCLRLTPGKVDRLGQRPSIQRFTQQ